MKEQGGRKGLMIPLMTSVTMVRTTLHLHRSHVYCYCPPPAQIDLLQFLTLHISPSLQLSVSTLSFFALPTSLPLLGFPHLSLSPLYSAHPSSIISSNALLFSSSVLPCLPPGLCTQSSLILYSLSPPPIHHRDLQSILFSLLVKLSFFSMQTLMMTIFLHLNLMRTYLMMIVCVYVHVCVCVCPCTHC